MSAQTLGIDVSARWFDVARDAEVRRFPNNAEGIAACLAWLSQLGAPVRAGMEATGVYHLPLAAALHAAGHAVLVCNPLSIARYAQAVLARTKTDATDARLIARFCGAHDGAPWTPTPAAQRRLQAPVLAAIETQIARIDPELATVGRSQTPVGERIRLLTGIPGLGVTTAATLLASLPLDRLRTPRQVAAYVGLCPRERSSGSSVRGRGRAGPLGPAHLRKALYLPAVVAMRFNPALRAVADRLGAAGKPPKVVITAVMRKLLLLAVALLRSGAPFSATHRCPEPFAAT